MKITKSEVLGMLGIVGVIGTAVLASQNTIKAKEMLDNNVTSDMTKVDRIKLTLPCYIPTLASGTATILCIAGSTILSKKQQVSLASAYALSSESFKRYRGKLIELHGEEMDQEIREAVVRSNPEFHEIGINFPDQKLTFYDDIGDRTFEMYERELMDAEYHFNRNYALSGYLSLNSFYEMIGLEPIKAGEIIGWTAEDGIYWIDIQHTPITKDGKTVYRLDYVFSPEPIEEYL